MPLGLFVFLAALAIISSLGVVIQRNPVHSLLALVLTLLVIAVLFIGFGAVTVGFLQAIVYAGAIMVLFLFVIWLLNLQVEERPTAHLALKFFGALASAALVAELFIFFAHAHPTLAAKQIAPGYGSIASIATVLFKDYLIAFEATSVLLLVAVVGAVAIARRSNPPASGTSGVKTGAAS
jgi:NADH-quinone oxidoreductase subunit J